MITHPPRHQKFPSSFWESYWVIGGGGNKTAKKGWDIELDIPPFDDNKVMNVTRSKLSVLGLEDDEKVEWHLTQAEKLQQITTKEEEKKKGPPPMAKCQVDFG